MNPRNAATTAARLLSLGTVLSVLLACGNDIPASARGYTIGTAETGPFDHAHTQWGLALDMYVDESGVDYDAVERDPRFLDRYLAAVVSVDSAEFDAWAEPAQMAYLANAYNALAIRTVAANYPIPRSLRPTALVRPGNSVWQIDGFFDEIRHRVAGRDLTLDDIQHDWLRRRHQDPRLHFALVCAARSCPPLRREPYRGDIMDNQLADQVRRFVQQPYNRFDPDADLVEISPLFDWFAEDFATLAPEDGYHLESDAQRGALALLARHLPDSIATWLHDGYYRVRYLDYDWSLNETR